MNYPYSGVSMLVKKLLFLVALSLSLFACSTDKMPHTGLWSGQETDTAKGIRYLLGRGVQQDDAKAFYYFKRAAQQNDPFAQNELAYLYAAGKGVKKSNNQAFFWYQEAATQGLASAEYNVGFFYLHGLGVKKDKKKAIYWFNQAAQKGFGPAVKILENLRAAS